MMRLLYQRFLETFFHTSMCAAAEDRTHELRPRTLPLNTLTQSFFYQLRASPAGYLNRLPILYLSS